MMRRQGYTDVQISERMSNTPKENVVDPKTGKKKTAQQTLREYMLEEQDNFRVVGTAMYAALAAHLPNKKYLKKDDIESLLYLLSYFGVG